jgi:galactose-1-phosphate uridylyltransferase
MNPNVIVFQPQIARQKPETIVHRDHSCPFCDVANLKKIIQQEADRIWLVNKYRTLAKTWQTVIIETAVHEGDISTYSHEQNRAILKFALNAWQQTQASGKYRSTALYKNYGPLSGGSLSHPHLQIVGFEEADIYQQIKPENFQGMKVVADDRVELNLATEPIMGFVEFNLILRDINQIDEFADYLQLIIQYLLGDYFNGRCNSYNLFFYPAPQQQIIAKVVPRFIASPYFVGYKASQVNDYQRLAEISQELAAKAQQKLPQYK